MSFGWIRGDFEKEIKAFQIFENNEKAFSDFIIWLEKQTAKDLAVQIVMETTGVHHEKFAYCLAAKPYEMAIILPDKVSNYAISLHIQTMTDKTSSQAICLFGPTRKLNNWEKTDDNYDELRQLSREKNQITDKRVMTLNQLQAEEKTSTSSFEKC